jgi:hypothetical protein
MSVPVELTMHSLLPVPVDASDATDEHAEIPDDSQSELSVSVSQVAQRTGLVV